jgi:hypothetical protein
MSWKTGIVAGSIIAYSDSLSINCYHCFIKGEVKKEKEGCISL